MVSVTKHNTPALRFDGFDGEWSETNLEQLFEYGGSGGTPSKSRPEFYGGSIPFLGIADIKDRVITHTEKMISELGLKNSAAWKIPEGAISLAMYASVGRVGIAGMELATSQAFYNMVFADEATRNFVFARLAKMESMSEWEAQISTGTQRNLNAFKVRTFPIKTPFSLEEQRAIGELFADLDALIEQHRAKHAKLKQTKTALLQRMFPKGGAEEPELRLGGFAGAWEKRDFGSVVTRSSAVSADPTLPRLEYEDIVSGVGVLNKDLSRKKSLKEGLLFGPGDVLYGKLRPYLRNWLLPQFSGIAVGDFWVLQSTIVNPIYLYQLIQTPLFAAVTNISSGSKMPRADWKLVSRSRMAFPPTLEEQRAIGEVFSNLDALIVAEQRYITQLNQAKTALLQRTFV